MDNPFDVLINEMRELKALVLHTNHVKNDSEPCYMKVEAAAAFLSTTPNALRVMVHKNQLPYLKKQGKLFFRQRDLIDWMESGNCEDGKLDAESILTFKIKKGGSRP